MKLKKLSLFIAGCLALAACNKETPYHEVVYFTDVDSSPVKQLTVSPESSSLDVSVTCSDKVTSDLTVSIHADPSLIGLYQEYTGKKSVEALDGHFKLSSDNVTIKSGTNKSNPLTITIAPDTDLKERVTYCIPLVIGGVSDPDIFILAPSKIVYMVVTQKIITKAVDLKGRNYFAVQKFQKDKSLKLSAATMECRVWANSFASGNPGIASIIGMEENFLLRFGDPSISPEYLQVGPCVISGNKFFVTSKTKFSTEKWYHVAVTYNGSVISLYVDGKLDATTAAQAGTIDLTWDYDGGFHIGRSGGGRFLNGYVSEARVWRRALSEAELQEGICGVDPKADGLLAYWKLNALTEGVAKDETGNGFDAVPKGSVSFIDNVSCP